VNDLLIGLLSALVATNPPAAVSNLVQKKTGLSVAIADANDPVERAYRKLMTDDDDAQAEVDEWIRKRNESGKEQNDVEKAAFNLRIKHRFEPIVKGYEDFLAAHPNHANARIAYGSFLNDIGEESAAEAQWNKAREIDPKNPAPWNNLANFYGHNGNVKKSFEYYAKAMELDPTEPVYLQNFATTVFLFRKDAMEFYQITEQEVFAKAMGLYRKALSLDPENFSMAAELAQTYYGIKPPKFDDTNATRQAEVKLADEALAAWQVAQKIARNELEREGIHLHFARWQINTARYEEARKSLAAVTNDLWAASKKTLLTKLNSREAGKLTNAAPAELGRQAGPYPGCLKIFNGVNFEGWEADPSTWSIVDGSMRGVGGSSRLAFTKENYGSFRLIFTARMNPVNGDHLGVLFWGDRPENVTKPKIDNAGWIQFMPPHGAMWDYHPPKHHNLAHETLAVGSKDFTQWHTTEILCNLEKGTMRAAVDGVEIVRYTHPHSGERTDPEHRIVPGPIGMFRHGAGASEYKEIFLETNPKEDKLLTVR
jgi:tetratricopeptide (TPR) repeat protein